MIEKQAKSIPISALRSDRAPATVDWSDPGRRTAANLAEAGNDAVSSFHVALEAASARRSRQHPDQALITGLLLLDTGSATEVVVSVPIDLFWMMKTLEKAGRNCGCANAPSDLSPTGNIWLVDGVLENLETLRIFAVHALERLVVEPAGVRLVESFSVAGMLPRFLPDAA